MGSEKAAARIAFASAEEADRRVAGVAAAARAMRERAEAEPAHSAGGWRRAARSGDSGRYRAASRRRRRRDRWGLERRAGPLSIVILGDRAGAGKAGDGLVSRWLNRPISMRITCSCFNSRRTPDPRHGVQRAAGPRDVRGSARRGEAGLIAGAILFQAASVLDGVDGEMARATFRTSSAGASLDTAVDAATNLLFIVGLTVHLALRDGGAIGWIGGWSLVVAVVGWSLIARRVRAAGAPLGLDLFKRSGGVGSPFDLIYRIVQVLSGRDCYAFLYMLLIVAGFERTALIIYTSIATLWFMYVLALLSPPTQSLSRRGIET